MAARITAGKREAPTSFVDVEGTTVRPEYVDGIPALVVVEMWDPHDATIAATGRYVAAWRDRLRRARGPRPRSETSVDDLLRHLSDLQARGVKAYGRRNPWSYPALATALGRAVADAWESSFRDMAESLRTPKDNKPASVQLKDPAMLERAAKHIAGMFGGYTILWLVEVIRRLADSPDSAAARLNLQASIERMDRGEPVFAEPPFTGPVLRDRIRAWRESEHAKASPETPSLGQRVGAKDMISVGFCETYLRRHVAPEPPTER